MFSTRTPHTTPVIDEAVGFRRASAKNASNVVPASRRSCNADWSYPVSHSITWSSSGLDRPLRSTFAT